ncbi:MAG: hypothetical protein JSV57_03990, partial [Candidatus Bathyarchaeota archaeon]
YTNGEKALAIINTGNLGYYSDTARNVKLSLILGYGGPARGKGPFYLHGINRFKYTIYPHVGDWRKAKTVRRALEVNTPLIAFATEVHKGGLGRQKSFVRISPSNAILSAMICSRESKELTLRLFETEGRACTATIRLHKTIKEAWESDLRGRKSKSLTVRGNSVEGALRPWGLLCMKVAL